MVAPQYWREWYHAQHVARWTKHTGTQFEDDMSGILTVVYDDFLNPDPAGKLGDKKCDGIAVNGTIAFACYGSRPQVGSTEAAMLKKMKDDFEGALAEWPSFTEWRFVTNAKVGPNCTQYIIDMNDLHSERSERPIKLRLYREDKVWNELLSDLPSARLGLIFSGVPGEVRVELEDIVPLLDVLSNAGTIEDTGGAIREVPPTKMEFNRLGPATQFELQSGRRLAPRIDSWYAEHSDPDLYDKHGARFRSIYEEKAAAYADPSEIMEAMYSTIAEPGFRTDGRLAESVYTVTSYFFDSCHIFETPPETEAGESVVVANERN